MNAAGTDGPATTDIPDAGRLLALAYPAQIMRLARHWPLRRAAFAVLGKFAEAQGALGYYLGRIRGRRRGLVEYK